ncbi:ceramide kinase isoform X2 [Gymnogyps californianus]|uniref:ceramide kinase isoform X2 n=1 Tax=Gymnogyps californianus TaxID=33616 RepID=UPI0021C9AA79|nr:ceramide kinase isoform X2 [Gymnogyps californianus]
MEQLPGGRRPRRLVSSLGLGQRSWEVTLDEERGRLAWRDPRPPRRGGENCFVPTSEIIAVEETELNKKQHNTGKWQKMAKPHAFTVYYVKKARNHRWRCSDVTFWCVDERLCNQWIQALKELLEMQKSRPKQLLVYINPYGGKRQGKRIYEQKVAPLFSLASISTDVVITEHANHAKDNLFEVNINKYDGVVCVGGDGMFSEVMHGLIGRMQKDSGIDQNNPKAPLVQCNIRIGIIPAGSTDCICYSTVGISDPVTSALHIIVGDCQPLDVSSVHHNNTFLKYSVSLLGYGFYGDILKDSEKKRWMGPMRYDYSGFKTFLSHHYYEGTISFQPAKHTPGSPRDKDSCRTGCYICKKSEQQLAEQHKECGLKHADEEEWKVIKGKFLAINAVNMSCACPRSPKGLSPAAHLADGSADLILVRKCSRFDFLRYLVRHTNQDDQFDFSFVDVYRVKSFQFTSKLSEDNESNVTDIGKKRFGQFCRDHPACCCNIANSTWNCDGETLDSSAIEVRVHCQLMKLFARGIEKNCKDEAAYSQSSIEQLL